MVFRSRPVRGIVRTLVGRSSSLWPAYGPWFTIARGLHTPLVCCLWQTYARAHVMIRTTSLHLRVLSNEKRLWHCRRRSLSALFRIFNRFVSPVQCGRYKYYTQLETPVRYTQHALWGSLLPWSMVVWWWARPCHPCSLHTSGRPFPCVALANMQLCLRH